MPILDSIRKALEAGDKNAIEMALSIIGRVTIISLTEDEVAVLCNLPKA